MTPRPDYFVAPFTPGGDLIAVAGRSVSELSPRWLDFCRGLLRERGPVFHEPVPLPPLSHITLRFTSVDGAALVGLTVHGNAVSSAIALRGENPVTETDALKMFVESLRAVPLVKQAAEGASPFEAAFGLNERPLYVVVPWADPQIADGDQQLVMELENHLAAAFLRDPPHGSRRNGTSG